MFLAIKVEVRLTDELIDCVTRGHGRVATCADQKKSAVQILEIHAHFRGGQEIVHADEF